MKEFASKFNWLMMVCVIALTAMGAVFIWSVCSTRPPIPSHPGYWHGFWLSHVLTAVVGLLLYFSFSLFDYRRLLRWAALPGYLLALACLVAVLVFGREHFGGKRWLWFFQPSEVAKLAVILFAARFFARDGFRKARTVLAATSLFVLGALPPVALLAVAPLPTAVFIPLAVVLSLVAGTGLAAVLLPRTGPDTRTFLAALPVLGVPLLLILKEPDLGSALVLVPAVLVMMLAARIWTRGLVTLLLAGALAAGAVLGTVYVAERQPDPERRARIYSRLPLREHQIKRLRVFLFPERDRQNSGYNLRQAQISIGSGSLWGKGLQKSSQKLLGFLPATVQMNDFIFAVLAEEKGFMGTLLLLLLYLGVLVPGARIAMRASDDEGRLLALGILTLVFCHLFVNIAMSIGLMPITGLPLPFISQGRTFLIVLMVGLGIVQSVSVYRSDSLRETHL